MAKEEATKTVKDVTLENIEDVINSGSTATKESAEEAAKIIAEKRKEQVTARLVEATLKSEYTRKSIFLSMKQTDKVKEVKLNYLKKFSEEDEKLRNGGITIEDYEKNCLELKRTAKKLIMEVDTWMQEQKEKLYNQYPDSRYSWGYSEFSI